MQCNNPIDKDKCGKCEFDLMSSDFAKNKSLVSIARVLVNISWMDDFNDSMKNISRIHWIRVTCTGKVKMCVPYNRKVNITIMKNIVTRMFNNWYKHHESFKKLDSYEYIVQKMKAINNATVIRQVRTHLVSIAKYLEAITICTGYCQTIVPGKEVGNCKFALSDINKICKFSSEGIVDLFNTILYTVKDLEPFNLTIDFDTTYVTCAGNVIMERNFVKCKSTFASLKANYIYYLSSWCSANFCKHGDTDKIRNNLDEVRRARTINELYEVSCQLLEVI